MDGWTDGQMDGWTDGRTDGWTDGWTDGRTDGWTDGRTDGWTDGRTGDNFGPSIFFILRYIKHYTYVLITIYIKVVRTNFL